MAPKSCQIQMFCLSSKTCQNNAVIPQSKYSLSWSYSINSLTFINEFVNDQHNGCNCAFCDITALFGIFQGSNKQYLTRLRHPVTDTKITQEYEKYSTREIYMTMAKGECRLSAQEFKIWSVLLFDQQYRISVIVLWYNSSESPASHMVKSTQHTTENFRNSLV